MARITSQKAIEAVGGNQFLLIVMASYRARLLKSGKDKPRVDTKGDKMPVVAIREIEEGKYTEEEYKQNLQGIGLTDSNQEEDEDEYQS
jgi:DNA-directed RNA polymerase omega subunit